MDLGRLEELLGALPAGGRGLTIRRVSAGDRAGGIGSEAVQESDGWEIGWISGSGGGEFGVAPTLAKAVELAFSEF